MAPALGGWSGARGTSGAGGGAPELRVGRPRRTSPQQLLLRRGERHRERVLLLVRRQAVLAPGRDAARRAAARKVAMDLELHARRRSRRELPEDDLAEAPVRVHGAAVGLDDVRGPAALAALA